MRPATIHPPNGALRACSERRRWKRECVTAQRDQGESDRHVHESLHAYSRDRSTAGGRLPQVRSIGCPGVPVPFRRREAPQLGFLSRLAPMRQCRKQRRARAASRRHFVSGNQIASSGMTRPGKRPIVSSSSSPAVASTMYSPLSLRRKTSTACSSGSTNTSHGTCALA